MKKASILTYSNITICPICEEGYTDSFASCPNRCKTVTQSRKIAPKAKARDSSAMSMPLSAKQYQDASSNTVSNQEYKRYLVLCRLQDKGIISDLELQIKYEVLPRIEIKPDVNWYKSFTQSRVTYSPDFRFVYNGMVIVEEYKALNFGTKKKPLKTPKPIITTASRKSIKELMALNPDFASGTVLFVITCWNKRTKLYEAFNANSKRMVDYPLANTGVIS